LADAILSAPFEAGGWGLALKKLASATSSARTQLVAFGGPSTIPLNWVTDPEPGFIEEFPLIDGGSPTVNWRVACSAAPLQLAWEHQYDVARRKLRSSIYDEFVDRYDLPYGCQTVLLKTPEVFFGLATLRSTSDGPTSEFDRAVFAQAAPHVLTSIKVQQALEHKGAALIVGAFESIGSAIFLCDRAGQVRGLTSAAEAKLRDGIGIRLRRGRLVADRADDNRTLQNALLRVLNHSDPLPEAVQFWVGDGLMSPHAHRCEVLPLPRNEWSLGFEARAMVVVHATNGIDGSHRHRLRTWMGLNSAETEIAILIAGGLSREEVAARRGVSVNTVTSQLKSIFMKADVTREAQLVALLNQMLR
jgi:DNA-binding CsgD family transcriptional regulator